MYNRPTCAGSFGWLEDFPADAFAPVFDIPGVTNKAATYLICNLARDAYFWSDGERERGREKEHRIDGGVRNSEGATEHGNRAQIASRGQRRWGRRRCTLGGVGSGFKGWEGYNISEWRQGASLLATGKLIKFLQAAWKG